MGLNCWGGIMSVALILFHFKNQKIYLEVGEGKTKREERSNLNYKAAKTHSNNSWGDCEYKSNIQMR